MQKLKRWVAGALAALLLVAVPARSLAVVAYADAAGSTVTVAAAAGGGGLGAAAVGSVAAGVVAGALLALGVRAFVSGADAAGMTKTEYIGSLMQQWSETEYGNAQQLADDVAYSTYITSNGAVHIKEAAAKKIKAFGDWLMTRPDVYPSASAIPGPSYTLPSGSKLASPLGFSASYKFGGSTGTCLPHIGTTSLVTYLVMVDSGYAILSVDGKQNTDPSVFKFVSRTESYTGANRYGNTPVRYIVIGNSPISSYSGYLLSNVSYPSALPAYSGTYFTDNLLPEFADKYSDINYTSVDQAIIGDPTAWGENEDVIDLGKPDAGDITLNPDVLPNLDITGELTATQDLVISLQDYIQSLIDVINGYRDKVIELTDALTGEKVGTAELPDIETLDPSITVPLNPEISIPDDAIGVIDGEIPAPPPPVPPGNKIIADYSYDLTSVFPFCIPFDIVRALRLLDAEPEAPSATMSWHIPVVGLDYDMEIDLAPWSGVAQVLRTMELLLFTIGLGLVTRKLIMA